MTTALPLEELGLTRSFAELEKELVKGQAKIMPSASAGIKRKLDAGSATLEDIEEFLKTTAEVPDDLRPELVKFLRSRRGWFLLNAGRKAEALAESDSITKTYPRAPEGLALRAAALTGLQRFDEACQAFRTAFETNNGEAKPQKCLLRVIG